jgi:glucose/arabinose dehydrogenase
VPKHMKAVWGALLIPATLVAGATPVAATIAPTSVTASFRTVVTGFSSPTSVTSARDGSGRLFVVEQGGLVRLVAHSSIQHAAYLDLRSRISSGGERGLLDLVFHPGFKSRPYVYASYTRKSDGALVVSQFTARTSSSASVSAATERQLLVVKHPNQSNHNSGQLMFGFDRYFYITTGDGGGSGDPYGNAENMKSLSGKLLRINVDSHCGRIHYCIPSNNPYARSSTVSHEIFDFGLRNAWRASVDRADGTLWLGDVGQDVYEEIDHVSTRGGKDFGWSCKEGNATYNSNRCTINGRSRSIQGPVFVYSHGSNDSTGCAVIGGYAYAGPTYSFARGLYVLTDYCSAKVWAIGRTSSGGYQTAEVGTAPASPSGFGEGDTGEMYLVTQGSGGLYHLVFTQK